MDSKHENSTPQKGMGRWSELIVAGLTNRGMQQPNTPLQEGKEDLGRVVLEWGGAQTTMPGGRHTSRKEKLMATGLTKQ